MPLAVTSFNVPPDLRNLREVFCESPRPSRDEIRYILTNQGLLATLAASARWPGFFSLFGANVVGQLQKRCETPSPHPRPAAFRWSVSRQNGASLAYQTAVVGDLRHKPLGMLHATLTAVFMRLGLARCGKRAYWERK